MEQQIINFDPKLKKAAKNELLEFCKIIIQTFNKISTLERYDFLVEQKRILIKSYSGGKIHKRVEISFLKSLLLDLLFQDWDLKVKKGKILLLQNKYSLQEKKYSLDREKEKTRRKHLLQRNEQLSIPSVYEFVRNMEKKKLTKNGWHSIFSLMRDGRELHDKLSSLREDKNLDLKFEKLQEVIKPYIQFVEPNIRCEYSGLLLSEIWRYFRHTWVNEYKSLPGRSIYILVRDAAATNHPIIGIAALGSSVAQQKCRDEWIGWDGKTFLKKFIEDPSSTKGKWILNTVNELISDIYIKDFLASGIISKRDVKFPNEKIVYKLKQISTKYKLEHIKNPHESKFNIDNSNLTWENRAKSNLFKSKRALALSELLEIKKILQEFHFITTTKVKLEESLKHKEFQNIVEKLARRVKSVHLGIDMMDIIVCGSVAPYNILTGGKLVSMLMLSPEITQFYKKKYKTSISLIASSMKGKAVKRIPNLVLLNTTSLYHVGSSQYNRIKIPANEIGGTKDRTLQFERIGSSEGYGSFQFSKDTINLANIVLGRYQGNVRVNSIFGEGANPLLRKLKDALEVLDIESNPILNHGSPRVVYGIALAENFRNILIGFEKKTKYILPQQIKNYVSDLIVKYWSRRWLYNRIEKNEILIKLNEHSLSYPITHGARVPLINTKNEDNITLF